MWYRIKNIFQTNKEVIFTINSTNSIFKKIFQTFSKKNSVNTEKHIC